MNKKRYTRAKKGLDEATGGIGTRPEYKEAQLWQP